MFPFDACLSSLLFTWFMLCLENMMQHELGCKGHSVLKTPNNGKGQCLSFIQEVWRRELEDFSRLTLRNKKNLVWLSVIFSRPPTIQHSVTPLPLNVSQNKFKSNLKPVLYFVFLCKRYNLPCQMKKSFCCTLACSLPADMQGYSKNRIKDF